MLQGTFALEWAEARLTVSGADITIVSATVAERSTGFNGISLGAKFTVAGETGPVIRFRSSRATRDPFRLGSHPTGAWWVHSHR